MINKYCSVPLHQTFSNRKSLKEGKSQKEGNQSLKGKITEIICFKYSTSDCGRSSWNREDMGTMITDSITVNNYPKVFASILPIQSVLSTILETKSSQIINFHSEILGSMEDTDSGKL